MKKLMKNKKGFTLVELVVVIAILAVLALILVPSITGYVGKANAEKDAANARALYTSAVLEVATTENPQIADVIDKIATENGISDEDKATIVFTLDENGTVSGFKFKEISMPQN